MNPITTIVLNMTDSAAQITANAVTINRVNGLMITGELARIESHIESLKRDLEKLKGLARDQR